MGWTNPSTWVAESVPTAANFNQQIRDNLNAVGDHTGWSTYAPALTCTGTTDPNPASKSGQYLRVGNLVFYAYRIVSGATVGNGAYSVSLPVNGNMDNNLRAGSGYLYDASAYDGWTTVHYSSSTAATAVKIMWNEKTGAGYVSNSSPFAFGSSDIIAGQLIYRAAT